MVCRGRRPDSGGRVRVCHTCVRCSVRDNNDYFEKPSSVMWNRPNPARFQTQEANFTTQALKMWHWFHFIFVAGATKTFDVVSFGIFQFFTFPSVFFKKKKSFYPFSSLSSPQTLILSFAAMMRRLSALTKVLKSSRFISDPPHANSHCAVRSSARFLRKQ